MEDPHLKFHGTRDNLQMRHSSISVTFDVYGHLFPGHLDDVMAQLDAEHRAARGTAQ